MIWKLAKLFSGWICGYFVVNWLPAELPVQFDEYLVEIIFSPIEFLAAAIGFVIGMYLLGEMLRNGLSAILKIIQGKKGIHSDIIMGIGSIVCFISLLPSGGWQTAVFFCFCLLYGMISFSPSRAKMEN